MRTYLPIFVTSLLFGMPLFADVVCPVAGLQDTYSDSVDHWKKFEKTTFPKSTSDRDTHDINPPYSPSTISRLLFHEETGIFQIDPTTQQFTIRPKGQISTAELNDIKANYNKYLTQAHGARRDALVQLKDSNFSNVAQFQDSMETQLIEIEAPLINQYQLRQKLYSAKSCEEINTVVRGYFNVADKLMTALENEFAGLANLSEKAPFKGDSAMLEDDVTAICYEDLKVSRFGKWKEIERNSSGDIDINAEAWAKEFSPSKSINWQDYWALVGGSLDGMFINTKNQSAIKALVEYGRFPQKRTPAVKKQIDSLCKEVTDVENTVIAKVQKIDESISAATGH